jgi:uncharacterized membrane protein YeaQ/YmgE (transglycosylase-associated protein family)
VEVVKLLLLGLAVGVVARLVTPGRHSLGVLVTTLLGVLGTVGGGLLADQTGVEGGLRWVVIVGVAVVLLLLVEAARAASRRRRAADKP